MQLVDYAVLPDDMLSKSALVLARVAGYDTACYGLKGTQAYPFLALPAPNLLVAATQLSHARRRRFAPSDRWMQVVPVAPALASQSLCFCAAGLAAAQHCQPMLNRQVAAYVLTFVSGGIWRPPGGALWTPVVTASHGPAGPLPVDAERQALERGVQFYRNARLLPDVSRAVALGMLYALPAEEQPDALRKYTRLAPPYEAPVSGDGQLGVFEGLTSDIDITGQQPQCPGVRCDCVTETSASFAARGVLTGNASDQLVSTNLLNFGHLHSGYHQQWALGAGAPDSQNVVRANRPWIVSGDAFGVKSWTTSDHAYRLFYSDDDARGLLGAVCTAGLTR